MLLKKNTFAGLIKSLIPFLVIALIMGCLDSGGNENNSIPQIHELFAQPFENNIGDTVIVTCFVIDDYSRPGGCLNIAADYEERMTYSWSCDKGTLAVIDSFNMYHVYYIPSDTGVSYVRVTVSDGEYETTDSTVVIAHSGANLLNGPLSGILHDTTYIVNDFIRVDEGDTLTIEPGTVLSFSSGSEYSNIMFDINGCLIANGNETDSIAFDNRFPSTSWGGIAFYNTSTGSELNYCKVIDSHYGIRINNCSPLITGCSVVEATITGLSVQYSNSEITDCEFIFNQMAGIVVDGGNYYLGSYSPKISGCRILNSLGWGIFTSGHAIVEISECIIAGNDGGINFTDNNGSMVRNCTIYGNEESQGAGLYIQGSSISAVNCIISGNEGWNAVYLDDPNYTVDAEYNCLYDNILTNFSVNCDDNWGILTQVNTIGDSCDTEHNIFLDPMFISAFSGNFSLTPGSPCIDAGDPNYIDPDGTTSDIGAVYYPH